MGGFCETVDVPATLHRIQFAGAGFASLRADKLEGDDRNAITLCPDHSRTWWCSSGTNPKSYGGAEAEQPAAVVFGHWFRDRPLPLPLARPAATSRPCPAPIGRPCAGPRLDVEASLRARPRLV